VPAPSPFWVTPLGSTLEVARQGLVLLMFASAFFVLVEPAPTDLLFVLSLLCFVGSGLRLTAAMVPLILFLLLYNLGGLIGLVGFQADAKAGMFIVTSLYMGAMAMFVAFYVAYDPLRRFEIIRAGLYVSAFLASVFALMDYFAVGSVPHMMPGRATGLFKDPNVFSTFIIFPAILMLQSLLIGNSKRPITLTLMFLVVAGALFLSFSRGAWMNFLAAAALMALLTFALNPQGHLRSRILIIGIAAVIVGFIGISALMANEHVRAMFAERFSLVQSYDTGETGRFGNQMRSIPLLFSSPFGLGPLQFRNHFGLEPHNTFLNAFASYGWLGGMAYLLLVVSTIAIGIRATFTRSVLQPHVIGVLCPMVAVIIQGVQIDTDHWRHFYWMLGVLWGLSAVVLREPSNSHEEFSQSPQTA